MSLSSINSEFVSQSSSSSSSMLTVEKGGRGIYEHPVLVMDRIKQHIASLEVIAVGDKAYPVLLLDICKKSRVVQKKLQALLSTASSATECRKKYSQMLQLLERWVGITTRYALFFDLYGGHCSILLDLRERFPNKNRTPMPSNDIVSDEFRAIERWLAERGVIYQALDTLCGEDFEVRKMVWCKAKGNAVLLTLQSTNRRC